MLKTLKSSILKTLKQSGAFHRLAESRWRTNRLLILCYHGISVEDEHEWWPSTYMTASVLESRLSTLRSGGYTVLPLQEALSKLYSNSLPPKSVVITFDDGLHNFYSKAFPILQKFGFPATLYLTTYYCYENLPVFPLVCSYMLWKQRGTSVPANPALGLTEAPNLSTAAGRIEAGGKVIKFAEQHRLTAQQKNELAKGLADHLHLDFQSIVSKRLFNLVTPAETKEMARQGIDIQLHTHRHRTPMDSALFQKEVTDNRSAIEDLTGSAALHFCYPSGVYRPHYLPLLKDLNVASATTCDHALATAQTNPLLLPRFLDSSNVTPIDFESWLAGISAAFSPRNPFDR